MYLRIVNAIADVESSTPRLVAETIAITRTPNEIPNTPAKVDLTPY